MVSVFKILGWLEGASFLVLLIVAMPMKYMAGNPAFVKTMGPIHGGLFVAYILFANFVASEMNWPTKTKLLAFVAAVLPAGTFWFERKYLKTEKA
jgi:integral membrane protein